MNRRNFLKATAGVGIAGALAGCFTPVPTGGPGGAGGVPPAEIPVQPAVQRDQADVIVNSMDGLVSEARSGSRRVIWIEAGQYELRESFVTRNTIASGRGQDSGVATINVPVSGVRSEAYRGGEADGVIELEDEGRVSGIQLVGNEVGAHDHPRYDGYHPQPSGSRAERFAYYDRHHGRGINILGRGCSVDNSVITHFATQCVVVGNSSTAVSPIISACHLANSMMSSAGYGVDVKRGRARVQNTYINATRHAICGFGHPDSGYELSNVVLGPDHSGHIVDMHRLGNNLETTSSNPSSEIWRHRAGRLMTIDGCEFRSATRIQEEGGGHNSAMRVRGVPAEGVSFVNNLLPWDSLDSALEQTGIPDAFQDQLGDLGFTSLSADGNQLGYSP